MEETSMKFINPYHFIHLGDGVKCQEESEASNGITGFITYKLKTKTPLFIPNTSNDKAFEVENAADEHKVYDFFSYHTLEQGKTYNDNYFYPVIPGSEVRGMIRSIYETLTDSCLSVLDGETRITKRTVQTFTPGLLKRVNGKVYLYSADKMDLICRNRKDFSEKKYKKISQKDGSRVCYEIDPAKECDEENSKGNEHAKINVKIVEASKSVGYLMKGRRGPSIQPSKSKKQKCNACNCNVKNNPLGAQCKGYNSDSEHCYLAEKHNAHIFVFKEKNKIVNDIDDTTLRREGQIIDEVALADLGKMIAIYQKNGNTEEEEEQYKKKGYTEENMPKPYAEYKESYEDFLEGKQNVLPVYFSNIGHVILSPACITRELYQHTEKDIVKDYGNCANKKTNGKVKLCQACQLFGIVGDEYNRGSCIRFADLQVDGQQNKQPIEFYDKGLLTLEELSTPKLSTTEFYLEKPVDADGEVIFWTYDYYLVMKKDGEVLLKTDTPEIAGRKFYWHNLSGVTNCPEKNKRNRTVRTVKKDVEFTGKLYFDQITETQLKQLVYILQYTADGMHGFKLGGGKPLGLGSVELHVESVQIRNYCSGEYKISKSDGSQWYVKDDQDLHKKLKIDQTSEAALAFMTQYLDTTIQYPKREESEESFKWFEKNKQAYSGHKQRGNKQRDEKFVFDEEDSRKTTDSPNDRRQVIIQQYLDTKKVGEIPYLYSEKENSFPVVQTQASVKPNNNQTKPKQNVTNTNTAGNTNSKQTKGKSKTKPSSGDTSWSGNMGGLFKNIKID